MKCAEKDQKMTLNSEIEIFSANTIVRSKVSIRIFTTYSCYSIANFLIKPMNVLFKIQMVGPTSAFSIDVGLRICVPNSLHVCRAWLCVVMEVNSVSVFDPSTVDI